VILAELTRISSHLLAIGSMAFDIGVPTPFLYCFREREKILDLFERISGVRMMTSYITIGGLRNDPPEGWTDRVREFLSEFPGHIREYERMLTDNPIWLKRTRGVGRIDPKTALSFGLTGPNLRGSGVSRDVRRDHPYSGYQDYEFDIPVGESGDVFDRYRVRMEEMRQSLRIIEQGVARLPGGPFRTDDRKVAPPMRKEIEEDMEALIHHFLLFSTGFSPPPGEAFASVEGPRGEVGFYVVSNGTSHPYRAKVRAPSFANLQGVPAMARGGLVADLVSVIGSVDPVMGEVDR
jgi:NADH-quinone oxidoreductase subunit D